MISRMAVRSLKAGRLRNIFVMITIVLASSLLAAILMFAAGGSRRKMHFHTGIRLSILIWTKNRCINLKRMTASHIRYA